MIKRAILNTENVWFVDKLEGFDLKTFNNIIIAKNKDNYVFLVKETSNEYDKTTVELIDINYPEPFEKRLSLHTLFEDYEIYVCDNLIEVAELIKENGWKL